MKITHKKGFTLIEAAISILIVAIVAITVGMMMTQMVTTTSNRQSFNKLNTELRLVMGRMIREMRAIRTNTGTDLVVGTNSISFVDIDGTSISYALSGSTITRNGTVIARNITGLTFTYYTSAGDTTTTNTEVRFIRATISASVGGKNRSLTSVAFLRNVA